MKNYRLLPISNRLLPISKWLLPIHISGVLPSGGLLAHWILPAEFHVLLIGEVVEPLAPPMPVIILNALRAFALDCCHSS
jgi:hypothetical protein